MRSIEIYGERSGLLAMVVLEGDDPTTTYVSAYTNMLDGMMMSDIWSAMKKEGSGPPAHWEKIEDEKKQQDIMAQWCLLAEGDELSITVYLCRLESEGMKYLGVQI